MENNSFFDYLNKNVIYYNGKYTKHMSLPLSIQLEVTSSCNMKCCYCYNSSGTTKCSDLDAEKWKTVLNHVVNSGGVFQCTFSGGEPFLLHDIFELMDIMHNDGTCLSLITNGTFLTDENVKKLLKYRWYWIQVSLDSASELLNDTARGYVGGWKKAILGITNLKKYSLPVHVAAVVTRDTLEHMEDMVKLCTSLNVDKIRFSEVLYSGKACTTRLCFSEIEKSVFLRSVKQLKEKYTDSIEIELAASYDFQLKNCLKYSPVSIIIRPNGDVKIDCVLPYVIGNAYNEAITDIWKRIYKLYESKQFTEYINQALQGNITARNNLDPDIIFNS